MSQVFQFESFELLILDSPRLLAVCCANVIPRRKKAGQRFYTLSFLLRGRTIEFEQLWIDAAIVYGGLL
jgi:hypothetical protein